MDNLFFGDMTGPQKPTQKTKPEKIWEGKWKTYL